MQYPNGFVNMGAYQNYMPQQQVAPTIPQFSSTTTPAYINANAQAQQPVTNQSTWAWVQGEAGAKAYAVAPNNMVLLIDSDAPKMYMKSTDASGKPQAMEIRYLVTEDEYKKLQEMTQSPPLKMDEYVTKEDFEKYILSAEKKFVIRKEKQSNGKSSV